MRNCWNYSHQAFWIWLCFICLLHDEEEHSSSAWAWNVGVCQCSTSSYSQRSALWETQMFPVSPAGSVTLAWSCSGWENACGQLAWSLFSICTAVLILSRCHNARSEENLKFICNCVMITDAEWRPRLDLCNFNVWRGSKGYALWVVKHCWKAQKLVQNLCLLHFLFFLISACSYQLLRSDDSSQEGCNS